MSRHYVFTHIVIPALSRNLRQNSKQKRDARFREHDTKLFAVSPAQNQNSRFVIPALSRNLRQNSKQKRDARFREHDMKLFVVSPQNQNSRFVIPA